MSNFWQLSEVQFPKQVMVSAELEIVFHSAGHLIFLFLLVFSLPLWVRCIMLLCFSPRGKILLRMPLLTLELLPCSWCYKLPKSCLALALLAHTVVLSPLEGDFCLCSVTSFNLFFHSLKGFPLHPLHIYRLVAAEGPLELGDYFATNRLFEVYGVLSPSMQNYW